MDVGIISKRYAKAIFLFALEKGDEKQLHDKMKMLSGQFIAFPELKKILEDPTVSSDNKIKVLLTAVGENTGETYRQAIKLVIENGRGRYMQSIALMYDQIYRKEKNILAVKLTSTETLNDETMKKLVEILTGGKHESVEFSAKTDAGIIGGFILEVEDRRLDASVKNQLNQLRLELIN
jgi:F-type H+-transporting ATPase subunit delta